MGVVVVDVQPVVVGKRDAHFFGKHAVAQALGGLDFLRIGCQADAEIAR